MSLTFAQQLKALKQSKKPKTSSAAQDSLDVEEKLGNFPGSVHKLWALRRKNLEPTPLLQQPPVLPERGGAIAICLTVVGALPHEGLWRRWLEGGSSNGDKNGRKQSSDGCLAGDPRGRQGRLHIHAKHPDVLKERQPWCGERTLEHSYKPEWNDVKVARAMLSLLKRALEDADTQFIYLGTESCVPVRPFSEFADVLWHQGPVSWVPMWPEDPHPGSGLKRADKFECSAQFAQVDTAVVPRSCVWKSLPGWVFLARHHAQAIVDLETRVGGQLWPAFEQVFAPEEMFFPTMLALAGYAPSSALPPRPAPPASAAARSGATGTTAAAATTAASADTPSSSSSSSSSSSWAPAKQQVRVQPLVFAQYPMAGPNRANPLALDGNFGPEFLARVRRDGFLVVRKFKEPLDDALQELLVGGGDDSAGDSLSCRGARASSGIKDRGEGRSTAASLDKEEGTIHRQREGVGGGRHEGDRGGDGTDFRKRRRSRSRSQERGYRGRER